MNLFKFNGKATRVCMVENLNPTKGAFSMMRVSKDQKKYVVCLCLAARTVKTTFKSESSALEQMKKYRQLYKELKEQ